MKKGYFHPVDPHTMEKLKKVEKVVKVEKVDQHTKGLNALPHKKCHQDVN